jgi:hypothetical protein
MSTKAPDREKRYSSIEEIERDLFPEAWKRKREERRRPKSAVPFPISGRVW